jgi:V8-like Glu-specific endopeptidase
MLMLLNRSRRVFGILCLLSILCVLIFGTIIAMREPASAQLQANPFAERQTSEDYWTAERMRDAKPLPAPVPTISSTVTPFVTKTGTSVGENGKLPTINVAPDPQNLLFTPKEPVSSVGESLLQPQNVGTSGAYFTSSRLIPLTADLEYPYKTVGKLFFTKPGIGDYLCSGAVIKPRIILTAGHCVHNGNGNNNGFYTNFIFVPAYRDGTAPYQRWSGSYVVTTPDWYTGGGNVPNPADYAMIELADYSSGGTLQKIGDITGYLGYLTQNLIPNHATLLGYPSNLDNGEKMHQVTAGSFQSQQSLNVVEYGSDMGGGSSGGPWIQNFGVPAVGQTNGQNSGTNQIIGISSYVSSSNTPLYEGSSIPDSRFTSILNTICNHKSGNC